jgi:DNA-binding IclR family transcriptional regulator
MIGGLVQTFPSPVTVNAMNKFARMMDVLDLFSGQVTLLTAEDIAERLQVSRPTAFRYAGELCSAGFLANYSGRYSLGARIITLDYRIRESDPVLRIARPVMRQLAADMVATAVLCRMYNEDVINVHQEEVKPDDGAIYGRGRPLPLFRGAASKIMLAFLPQAKIRKIYERHSDHPDIRAVSVSWEEFNSTLKAIRRKGFYVSIREVNIDRVGVAAPITLSATGVIAVLSLALPDERLPLINLDGIGEEVKEKCREISRQLELLTETPATVSN